MPRPAFLPSQRHLPRVLLLSLGLGCTATALAQPAPPVTPETTAPRPRLGVTIRDGVLIDSVQSGFAAERIGIQPWDIIRKINGVSVSNATELARTVSRLAIDNPVSLLIFRDGKPMVLQAKSLRTTPNAAPAVATPQAPRPAPLEAGADVPASPELFQKLISAQWGTAADGSSSSPLKVSVSFDTFNMGDPQPNTVIVAGKNVQGIAAIPPDATYYSLAVRMSVIETYAGEVQYQYPVNSKYLAYILPRQGDVAEHWVVVESSRRA